MNSRNRKPWTWLAVTLYALMTLGIHAVQLRNGGCNGKCECVLSADDLVHDAERSESATRLTIAPSVQ